MTGLRLDADRKGILRTVRKLIFSIEKVIISIKKLNIFIKKTNISIEKLNISIERMKKLTVFEPFLRQYFSTSLVLSDIYNPQPQQPKEKAETRPVGSVPLRVCEVDQSFSVTGHPRYCSGFCNNQKKRQKHDR